MSQETTAQRLIDRIPKDPRDYHIIVGVSSIMMLPIDPKREGVADLLYLFDADRYPEGFEVLVHMFQDPEEQCHVTHTGDA